MHNELRLDEETHKYYLGDRSIIGVTEALSILDERWNVDPWYLERGRLIHLATEYYDNDELDESTVDDRIRPYFDAYKKFRDDTGFEPYWIEHKLYHPNYKYAGKLDRIGILNSNHTLIDLKSGSPVPVDKLQSTAYWELCKANNHKVDKIFDLYLHNDGTYKLEPIEKPKLLLPIFLAALTCKRWMEGI